MSSQGRAFVRWAEVLCDACQHQLLTRGWGQRFAHLLQGNLAACDGCRDRADRLLHDRNAEMLTMLRPFAWMPADQRREFDALHEAAHAVVGDEMGMSISGLVLEDTEVEFAGEPIRSNASVFWDLTAPGSTGVTLGEYAAMSVAGMQVTQRWLVENGYDTPENRIDVAFTGMNDVQNVERAIPDEVPDEVFTTARAEADLLIAEHRGEISGVQQELLRHGRLDYRQTRRAMSLGRRAARRNAADPEPRPATAALATTTTTTTTTSGGTAMGIDDIRQAMAISSEKATFIQGAMAQSEMWLDEILAQLHNAGAQESGQQSVTEAFAAFTQAKTDLEQFKGQISNAAAALDQYAGQL